MPIAFSLSSPELAELIAPHTSRLTGLAVRVDDTRSYLNRVAKHLRHPIPTLHTFRISATIPGLQKAEFALGVLDPFFLHSRNLVLDGITLFRRHLVVPDALKTFPHVTELTVHASDHVSIELVHFLETLEQLPMLERVFITFGGLGWSGHPRAITLPHVREMSVLVPKPGGLVPPILRYIKFPNLMSLRLQVQLSEAPSSFPVFPTESFDEYLPNLINLPDLQAIVGETSIEVTFRNPQAAFSYVATDGFKTYHRDRLIWGALPLHTVRRLLVDIRAPCEDVDHGWFVKMLQDLPHLERVDFGGNYPATVQCLCCNVARRRLRIPIRTLVECAAGEYETRGAQS